MHASPSKSLLSSVFVTTRSAKSLPNLVALALRGPHYGPCQGIPRFYSTSTVQTSDHLTTATVAGGILDQAAHLALSPQRREPEAWVALAEAFLPATLQSTSNAECNKPLEDTKYLSRLLSTARSTAPLKLDILGYMGIQEGRWDAVKWLANKLSEDKLTLTAHARLEVKEGFVPWSIAEPNPYGSSSLDEITTLPICFSVAAQAPPEGPARQNEVRLGLSSPLPRSEWLGQIWATLAFMTLQASDYPRGDVQGEKIMSLVLEIVAQLHSIDAVPSMIYSHSKCSGASGVHKPPTLSLMAYRMMTDLSDIAWKAQDERVRKEAQTVGAKNWYKGHELAEAIIQPRRSGVGKEIWMELILWCCVEGGFYHEASWIVTQMLERKGEMAWKVIDWSDIHRPTEPKLNWSARAELQIARANINQIGRGLGISGPSEAPPFVDMGPRTVSREVILALIDGLACSARSIVEVQQHIAACRNLLNKKRSLTLETKTLNRTIQKLFELGPVDIAHSPGLAERILSLTPDYYGTGVQSGSLPDSDAWGYIHHAEDDSTASFGLLHRTRYIYALRGNIQGTLRVFHKLQSMIDSDRHRRIDAFAEDLRYRLKQGDGDELMSESINDIIPSVYPQIPTYIMSAFLDLLTSAHLYDLGNWLLYSDEVDGPFLSPSSYSEVNLQSALLRFATATENGGLFARVSEKLHAPLAPKILRTLLHCQITLGKWEAAEEVLRHFQAEPGTGWEAIDIMVIVRSILRLENDDSPEPQSLAKAQILLQGLLNGDFNPARDPSKAADYSRFRCLYQIYRMLKQLPGSLRHLKEPPFSHISRANAPIEIASEAFDILLEGVVEARGSVRGQKLWQQWCQPIRPGSEVAVDDEGHESALERAVAPTLQTLRILMRPVLGKGNVINNSADTKLLAWAVRMCKEFGLTDREIKYELPISIDLI